MKAFSANYCRLACACVAAIAIGAPLQAAAQDKPKPDAQFGNVMFKTPDPAKWKRSEEGGRLVFSAPVPPPDFVTITAFPGSKLDGDFRQAFDAAVDREMKRLGVVKVDRDSGVTQGESTEGFPVLQRVLVGQTDRFHTAHWFLAGNSAGRFDLIGFQTSGEETYKLYGQDASTFFSSVKLANSLAPGMQSKIAVAGSAPAQAAAPPARLQPLAPRPGYVVGRGIFQDGRPVPRFTVEVSGFEDGKLASTNANGNLSETLISRINGVGGRYETRVAAGAYRVSAWTTCDYKGRTYNFEMEPLNEPAKFDYSGLSLEKLRGGIVRDLMLSMTGRKKDADETYEQGYYSAYYGGMLRVDSDQVEYQIGGGAQPPRTLHDSYPPDSKIEITLTPQGLMVDGAMGSTLVRPVRLGDDGHWQSTVRAIYPGTYTAAARLLTPDGQAVPLHLSLTHGKIELHPGGYDRMVMDWQSSVTVDFQPNDLGPMPRMGVKDIWLYFGK
jgi:hypothetical protein